MEPELKPYPFEIVLSEHPSIRQQAKNQFRTRGKSMVLGIMTFIGLILVGLLIVIF